MIKGRFMGDEVGMVTDPLLLFSQTSDAMLDISAWISEMRLARKETRMSQARAAGKIEWISPATVLDSVLSRQWGHAPGSERHEYCKPDFCVPRSTVPTPFAKLLFPSSELQHGFWPHSIQRSRYREQRRLTEMLGLKSELWHTLRSLAQSSMHTKSASSWIDDDYDVHAFVDAQIERMRNALTEAERAAVSAFTRQETDHAEEALGDIARFIEALAKALLPEPFREENTREEFAKLSNYSVERQAASSLDLLDLDDALKRLQEIFAKEGVLDERAAENFNWAFFDLRERASRNFEKMREFEAAKSDFSSGNELMNPQGLLRARLAKIMTGGVLPDEDFI